MRFLVDEDLASARLLAGLREAFGTEAVLRAPPGTADGDVWSQAQDAAAIIVTANARDFVPLARLRPEHAGVLLVAQQTMTAEEIVRRLRRLSDSYPDGVIGLVLSVNGLGGPGG